MRRLPYLSLWTSQLSDLQIPFVPIMTFGLLSFLSLDAVPRFSICKDILLLSHSPTLLVDDPGRFRNYSTHYFSPLPNATFRSAFLLLLGAFGTLLFTFRASQAEEKKTEGEDYSNYQIPERKDLPDFALEDILKHKTKTDRIWVTYQNGVYDITEWVDLHPGGNAKIMLAAGQAIDPFWHIYASHKEKHIFEILERYRIGNFKPSAEAALDASDPYATDPKRSPALIVQSKKPFNAETPRELLTEYLTPNDVFYVRNHLPVPTVDANDYVLTVTGEGFDSRTLTLSDLKNKFEKVSIDATLQCSGNRRNEMSSVKKVKGGSWDIGAISTAHWTGVRLRDVLLWLGVSEDRDNGIYHVQFEGLDKDMEKNYGASIPIEKAMDKYGDVLLAFEMNGEPLPRDHGFPVRVIVPGVVGARSVKWLGKIVVSKEESFAHWQRNDYKSFSPNTDWDTVDFKVAPAIQEFPVQSVITEPSPNSLVDGTDMTVKGVAWAGGGRAVIRVDVTLDEGKTWHTATLDPPPDLTSPHPFGKYNREWAWKIWSVNVPITKDMGGKDIQVSCRAWDTSYNTQPEKVENIWNLRGVLTNSWHRIKVRVSEE